MLKQVLLNLKQNYFPKTVKIINDDDLIEFYPFCEITSHNFPTIQIILSEQTFIILKIRINNGRKLIFMMLATKVGGRSNCGMLKDFIDSDKFPYGNICYLIKKERHLDNLDIEKLLNQISLIYNNSDLISEMVMISRSPSYVDYIQFDWDLIVKFIKENNHILRNLKMIDENLYQNRLLEWYNIISLLIRINSSNKTFEYSKDSFSFKVDFDTRYVPKVIWNLHPFIISSKRINPINSKNIQFIYYSNYRDLLESLNIKFIFSYIEKIGIFKDILCNIQRWSIDVF